MKGVIKLHLKENIKKNSFLIYGILGSIVTLIVLFQLEFSVNGGQATSDYAVYGVQWTLLSIIASLGGISLSMNVMSNHRQGSKRELLKLHGLSLDKQYLSLVTGNVLVTTLMALILCIGMFIQIALKGGGITIIGIIMAITFYLLTAMTATILISLLTLILPQALGALVGIIGIFLGTARGTLEISVGNSGGLFGNIMAVLLKLLPPIDKFSELTRDFFMREFSDFSKLFSSLFYLWLLIGITYLAIRLVAKNED